MIVPFVYELRQRGVPVGVQEALALASALEHGLHDSSLDGFYFVARSVLVHTCPPLRKPAQATVVAGLPSPSNSGSK